MATLTSVYADSTIVLGPLATEAQPEAYDLCDKHVSSFTAPRGWQIIRLATEFEPAPPSEDDLLALADAVVVTDVYPARETQADFPDITGDTVAQRVPGGTARFVAERLDAAHAVADLARPGDLLLTVGAGDVTELAGTVLGDLAAREGGAAPSPADRDERA